MGLRTPPSSPPKPRISSATPKRSFLRGFRRYRHRTFRLCGHQRSLEPIFGLRSLHPKIPFLAAGFRGAKTVRRLGNRGFWEAKMPFRAVAVNYCGLSPSASNCRPFCRSIAQSFNSNRGRRPSTASSDEIRCEERERNRHMDLTHTAFLAYRDLLDSNHQARHDLVKPATRLRRSHNAFESLWVICGNQLRFQRVAFDA